MTRQAADIKILQPHYRSMKPNADASRIGCIGILQASFRQLKVSVAKRNFVSNVVIYTCIQPVDDNTVRIFCQFVSNSNFLSKTMIRWLFFYGVELKDDLAGACRAGVFSSHVS